MAQTVRAALRLEPLDDFGGLLLSAMMTRVYLGTQLDRDVFAPVICIIPYYGPNSNYFTNGTVWVCSAKLRASMAGILGV